MFRILRASTNVFVNLRSLTAKQTLKDYKFPEVRKEDCEQKYISGWGPGGQKVNTAQNAVMLRHKPTNITVKVHESRLLTENINIAFDRLKHALDKHINGDNCYQAQYERIQREIEGRRNRQRKKNRHLKKALKEECESTS